MKQIPAQLLDAYKKRGRSTCFLIKIVDREGVPHGFTTLDDAVPFDDGTHALVYRPNQELSPQNILHTSDMEVDSTDLLGWFDDETEQRILSGAFSLAEITIYRVSYLRLEAGPEVVAYGVVGEVEYAANKQGRRRVEYRGLSQVIKQKKNPLYSLTCRAEFGDEDCGMPYEWFDGTVAEVTDPRSRFRLSGVSRPDGFFDLGVLELTSGPNTGKTLEVESWTEGGDVVLSFVTPYPVDPGTTVRIRRDCMKTQEACMSYGNIVNMRAEHLTPVEEQSLMVPGAYIKSSNAV